MKEKFKHIKGFPYLVGSNGTVISLHRGKKKTLQFRSVGVGYCGVGLNKNGSGKTHLVHRLVAIAFIPKTKNPLAKQVNHKNGIKTDNRVCNLEWVTHGQNIKHSWRYLGHKPNGLRGSDCAQAKLTEQRVIEARQRYTKGESAKALAKYMKVSLTIMHYALCGKSWKHVPNPCKMRPPAGTTHGNSKLTETEVRNIRTLRMGGLTLKIIAKKFSISQTTVSLICSGKSYRSVI